MYVEFINFCFTLLITIYFYVMLEYSKGGILLSTLDWSINKLDHDILLSHLLVSFGFSGIIPVLPDITPKSVVVEGTIAMPVTLKYRVPQDSVLRLLLFAVLIQPLGPAICHWDLQCYLCAVDLTN